MTIDQRPHILYIEDDPGHAVLARRALGRAGFDVEWVADGQAGLEASQARHHDAIILDQNIPNLSGLDVLRTLAGSEDAPPVIMVTGADNESVAVEAMKLGAADYVRKDPDLDYLKLIPAILRRTIDSRRFLEERRVAETALQAEREQFLSILENLEEGIYIADPGTHEVLFANAAMRRQYGGAGLVGQTCFSVLHDRDKACSFCVESRLLREPGQVHRCEHHNPVTSRDYDLTDRMVHWPDGRLVHFQSAVDITERKRAQERLEHLAYHDPLTGLPNRQLLRDRLEVALALAERHGHRLGILFIDVDNFKTVNDRFGHRSGDLLLKGVSDRLRHCVRRSDTVSRFGGDEFVVLLSELARGEDAAEVAAKIVGLMREPFRIEGHEVAGICSVGTSIYPHDGATADALFHSADAALYHAKAMGGGMYLRYGGPPGYRPPPRCLRDRLCRALDRREFEVHYQPLVALPSGQVTGAEALVRWRHPARGLLQPRDFLPQAEGFDLLREIDLHVLEVAARRAASWPSRSGIEPRIAVNLCPRLLRDPALPERVLAILSATGLPPHRLEVEISEAAAMEDLEASVDQLGVLRSHGVRLALDDFGSGHTSLAHLHRLPLHGVKLDQPFVRMLAEGQRSASIAQAVILVAHALDLEVTAEGVETDHELQTLICNGCDAMQGFLFRRALPGPEMDQLLADETRLGGTGLEREASAA